MKTETVLYLLATALVLGVILWFGNDFRKEVTPWLDKPIGQVPYRVLRDNLSLIFIILVMLGAYRNRN